MNQVSTEYGVLKKVLLCSPKFLDISTPINVIAEKHHETKIDIEKACKEHDEFVEVLRSYGIEVILSEMHPRFPYEVNTRDLGVTTKKGVLFGRFYSPYRWDEHRLAEKTLKEHKISIYSKQHEGTFEGGDFMYIDDSTVAVGTGIRTDSIGLSALKKTFDELNAEIIAVDFEEEYLHLDMILNVVGEKVAVVCKEALPKHIVDTLIQKGFELIEVTREDVFLHKCNLLNIGNNVIISHVQAADVNEKLRKLGFEVVELNLKEVLKSGGGPRCMSFPLNRI